MRSAIAAVVVLLGAVAGCARGSSPDLEPAASGDPTEPARMPMDASVVDSTTPDAAPADASPKAQDSGPPAPATSFSGTVDGIGLTPTEAFAVRQGGASATAIAVGLRNRTTFCADYASGTDRAGATTLLMYLDTTTSTITPGTYTVVTIGGVRTRARFFDYDNQCASTVAPSREWATAGTVTITSMTASTFVGSYTLDFGPDHVSGTFASTVCSAPGAPAVSCMP
jgi:hypothetical protein